MLPVAMLHLDLATVEYAVGPAVYSRGSRYARQGAVLSLGWNPEDNTISGAVRGRDGDSYSTTVYFSNGPGSTLAFELGECTCPVGYSCKHAVALVLTAVGYAALPAPKPAPTWEDSLGVLLRSGARPTGDTPLAIELAPNDGGRVLARLMRPGRNGWVNGGLGWGRLASLDGYLPVHVRLVQELYAMYRSVEDTRFHYYAGSERQIDLSEFTSPRLWPMLDEAATAGLELVHGRKRLGPIEPPGTATFCLDVTVGTELAVSPVLQVAGADPVLVGFVGDHGVVYVDRAEHAATTDPTQWRLGLARLTDTVSPELRRLTHSGQRLEIPLAEQDRFRERYFPRLRHLATVISSDKSFTPPEISGPHLVLHAAYGDKHQLDLEWAWAYRVGDAEPRTPLDAAPEDHRDVAAEQAILTQLDGLAPSVPRSRLRGIETMRFTTEVLPLLADQPGVVVEVDGEPADYREAGDSLVIGVSTDAVAGETDWFDLDITITVEGRTVPFLDVFLALSRDQSHLMLADGAYFSLEKPELRTLRELIDEARSLREASDGTLQISRFQAGLWAELAALGVVERQADAWQRQVDGLLSVESIVDTPVPAGLTAQLRPYQLDGFRWLAFLWEHRLGGILADDMGLGKTLQSLALICHARQSTPDSPPFLIVAPTSVVSNWAAEAARFAPELSVVAVSETARRRGRDLSVANADVVVTSYTLFRLDFADYAALPWSGLILDEAQYTKNHESKIYQCARRLAAPVKIAITGTPMENNLMELWSLLSITAPGLFPTPTRFRDYYARPIEKAGDVELLARLRRRVKPLLKRRTKEQVAADLPAKQEQVLEVELTPKHRKIYQTHLQRERQKILGLLDDMNRNRFTILRSLTVLRQLSLHAGLVDSTYDELPSAKIDALLDHLADVTAGGHRALVFSQFTGFLGRVRSGLDAAGIEYCYLDGRTRNRPAVLDRFKNGTAPVFLISLKAGGFGLNLTEADYCFLLDPWWNPATEAQAIDRTHRIGQTRNVMVYRLIAKDTIEEKVLTLQKRKAKLFKNVLDEGNELGTTLNADDIRGLFN